VAAREPQVTQRAGRGKAGPTVRSIASASAEYGSPGAEASRSGRGAMSPTTAPRSATSRIPGTIWASSIPVRSAIRRRDVHAAPLAAAKRTRPSSAAWRSVVLGVPRALGRLQDVEGARRARHLEPQQRRQTGSEIRLGHPGTA
jgi:hypothetical protein